MRYDLWNDTTDESDNALPLDSSSALGLPTQYRALLDNLSAGVSISQEDGTLVYTDRAEDRLFGYRTGELLGQHVLVQNDLPPEENERRVSEVINALKKAGS